MGNYSNADFLERVAQSKARLEARNRPREDKKPAALPLHFYRWGKPAQIAYLEKIQNKTLGRWL